MQVCTYTNVALKAKEIRNKSEATDKIVLDPLASPKQSEKSPCVTPIPKPTHVMNINSLLARVFVMQVVAHSMP